jgi:hypothetical protein
VPAVEPLPAGCREYVGAEQDGHEHHAHYRQLEQHVLKYEQLTPPGASRTDVSRIDSSREGVKAP